MKDKKGINNKAWQRRSFKVKYQSNIVERTLAGLNVTLSKKKIVQICITGANDRNKGMEKDQRINEI